MTELSYHYPEIDSLWVGTDGIVKITSHSGGLIFFKFLYVFDPRNSIDTLPGRTWVKNFGMPNWCLAPQNNGKNLDKISDAPFMPFDPMMLGMLWRNIHDLVEHYEVLLNERK